jgi:hypothetical protein
VKVFIGKSGKKSEAAATALHRWLTDVVQTIEPWTSQTDIEAGSRWGADVDQRLGDANFWVICLTRANLTAPWILFEAGALAKTIPDKPGEPRVCPYCIDLKPTDIPPGPLSQFQAKTADAEGTWDLLRAINKQNASRLPEDKLKKSFDKWWPDLQDALEALPDDGGKIAVRRQADDILTEILSIARDLQRQRGPLITSELLAKLKANLARAAEIPGLGTPSPALGLSDWTPKKTE